MNTETGKMKTNTKNVSLEHESSGVWKLEVYPMLVRCEGNLRGP